MLIGLVGAPNCGKSTFFKSATLADVLIANYPFATIKPNHAVGYVKIECIDKEFKVQCNPREGFCIKGVRFVPVEMMDVAGLVPGASEGKGLGNQFLDDLRQADIFIQIVDLSGNTNEEGKPADGFYPGKNIEFLERELDLWYAGILRKAWKIFSRATEIEKVSFAEAIAKQFSGLKVNEQDIKDVLVKNKSNFKFNVEHPTRWSEEEIFEFCKQLRRLTKPMIIAANKLDTPRAKENLEKIKKDFPHYKIFGCSAESELALREASKEGLISYVPGESKFTITAKGDEKLNERQKTALGFIQKNILDVYKTTGVQDILNYAVFDLLKYIAIFPAGVNKLSDSKGNILPDCFLMKDGSTALDFAYRLHSDFGKNFVKAVNVKTKQTVGKDYKLKHRDGIEIMAR